MIGGCSRCKRKNIGVRKWKSGLFCDKCYPHLEESKEPIGIGVRIVRTTKGDRIKGNKGNRNANDKHKMRTNLGMTWNWRGIK